jgi:hypothetical protein
MVKGGTRRTLGFKDFYLDVKLNKRSIIFLASLTLKRKQKTLSTCSRCVDFNKKCHRKATLKTLKFLRQISKIEIANLDFSLLNASIAASRLITSHGLSRKMLAIQSCRPMILHILLRSFLLRRFLHIHPTIHVLKTHNRHGLELHIGAGALGCELGSGGLGQSQHEA